MATLTDSSSTYSDAAASSSSSTQTSAPLPSGGSFPVCHDSSGPFAPFCQPTNGSDVWVGETYYGKFTSGLVRVPGQAQPKDGSQ